MAKPYQLVNETQNTLSTEYVRGTDSHVHLTSAAGFPTGGGYIRIGDSTSYCLCAYTAVSTNDLTTVTACTLGKVVSVGDETKTWPVGTVVLRVLMAEDLADLITGPPSATDGGVLCADGTTGKLAKQESGFVWDATNKLLTVTKLAIGATQGDYGVVLVNTTAAAAGAQQWSPPIRWKGYGWKTDSVAASQAVEFRSFVRPIEGAAAPTGGLDFCASINGAAYANVATLLSSGYLGLGITAPTSLVHAFGTAVIIHAEGVDESNADFQATVYGTAPRPGLAGRKARGTKASSTAAVAEDILLFFGGKGYGATAWPGTSNGAVLILAEDTFTDSSCPTKIAIGTTPAGSATRVTRMTIAGSGNIGIATPTPPTGGSIGAIAFAQTSDPTGVADNTAGFYAKDATGAKMYKFNDAGTCTLVG
jgi:hypothetical protein